MKKYLIINIVATCILLTACKQESVSARSDIPYTIDMAQLFENAEKTPDFKWNDLAERVDLVPLGKTERILSNLSVQGLTDDGKVLLVNMANGTITVADIESGKIISSFNRVGRAGNEYLMPTFGGPISANIYDDKISFYSEGVNKRIQVYDLYGRHLKSIDVKTDEYICSCRVIDSSTFALTHVPLPSQDKPYVPKHFITIINSEGEIIRTYLPSKFQYAPSAIMTSSNNPFRYHDGVLVSSGHVGNDTMYFVTKDRMYPFLITDFGERGEKRRRQLTHPERPSLVSEDIYWPFYHGYYKDMLFSTLIYLGKRCTNIWQRDQLLAFKRGAFSCDLPQGGSIELSDYFVFGNKLIAPIEAFHLVGLVDGVTEDDNPFLVVITLKDTLR